MRNLRLLALAVVATLALPLASARAEDPPPDDPCHDHESGTAVLCDPFKSSSGSSSGSQRATYSPIVGTNTASSSPGKTTSNASTKIYVPYNRLSTGPDGQPCATTGYVEMGQTPPDERLLVDPNPRETNIPIYGSDLKILEDYPPCPAAPLAPGQPAPVETRSMVAARIWELLPLTKPRPSIAPGRAITGKTAYLETNGNTADRYERGTVFGPLTIEARGSYTVDWGDGTTTGPHSFEGGAWPDGKITHQYIKVGTYNVVVTEKWTANWSLDGESGTLRTLQTTGRIDNFPVEQIQAVIGR